MPTEHPPRAVAWRAWAVPAALGAIALLLGIGGDAARAALRYERAALAVEPWRLVTGNLVHLGPTHLALNLAGLVLAAALARDLVAPERAASVLGCAALAVGIGLAAASPEVAWYVGLSGALHGYLAWTAAAALASPGARRVGAALSALLVAKLVAEQALGPADATVALIGAPVVVDAHLYGALGGLVGGLVGRVLGGRARDADASRV